MEKTFMPINRGTDKERRCNVCIYMCVCIYIYIYTHTTILTRRKEWNKAICSHMDKPRDNHTESSNSDKDNYHDITYM